MSEHNKNTINMYSSGGALEYIQNNQTNPETEKWERLLSYIETQLHSDKQKTILEFGSGCGELAVMLQAAGYNIIATDAVDTFLEEQNRVGINQVIKYNFLSDNFDTVFDFKADLIVSWRNPHLDIDDMKKLFEVAYNGLNDNGLLIINFQNADVHPNANVLSNGTKYEYKILEDKKTKEKRFYAYFSKEDIESLRKDYFDVEEYHTEGGKEQKNWHVLTLRKTTKK